MRNIGSLIIFAALVAIAATSGATFMPGDWYASLNKPAWTPPNWAFPVAWTILYILIAIAGWLTWKAAGFTHATVVWGIALILNALWSYIMFGQHQISLALLELVALWIAIILFIGMAWRVDARASYLFLPYLAWVTFAGTLNFAVWQLN
ncbi:TspO/MBR family protein [Hyphomicrobium sp. 99]|uniref:TspO/MBR family protein n=1 Tax=Hyphomicrobium sp. 99 TaxID=1163419 RepID=UPI0009E5F30B|nr:TspO/MBR family protein [Hyphomicrobium sp. 99]